MLVSPAEPELFRKIGTVSSKPEQYGADFLMLSPLFGRVGVQRKEIKDLIASLSDGRVEREVWQQKQLDQAIWLIEGRLEWTEDGQLLSSTRSKYTKAMHTGLLLSLFSNGYWMLSSSSVPDSIELLSALSRWLTKPSHTSLLRRPSLRTSYGAKAAKKDRQIHVMQGFDRIGYENARNIVEYYEGLPFDLGAGVDLTDVPGIGKAKAEQITSVVTRDRSV